MTRVAYRQIKSAHYGATTSLMENVSRKIWMSFAFGDGAYNGQPEIFYRDVTLGTITSRLTQQLRKETA